MLRDDINKALTEAMKAKNERAVSTLRMVNSTLKNADIEARGQGKPPLGDAEVLPVLQKMIKQRQELVELYQKGNRADLVKQEQEEIAIISGYLPKQMSDAEMAAAIEAAIKDTGAAGMKDMGKVIGALARQIRRADGYGQGERDGEGEAELKSSWPSLSRPFTSYYSCHAQKKTWMPDTRPGMTAKGGGSHEEYSCRRGFRGIAGDARLRRRLSQPADPRLHHH